MGCATRSNENPKNKEVIQNNLKRLGDCFKIIEKKKDIIQATHAVSLSSDNQKIVDVLEGEEERKREKLKDELHKKENSKENNLKSNYIDQKKINKMGEKLLDVAEMKVLDSIGNHVQEQMKKFENLGKN